MAKTAAKAIPETRAARSHTLGTLRRKSPTEPFSETIIKSNSHRDEVSPHGSA